MKTIKSCFNGYILSELWAEILSYLPLIVLLRFRSVSRLWKTIIENSNFISLHLGHSPNNVHNPSLILWEKVEVKRDRARYCHRGRDYHHRWVIRQFKTYPKVLEEIEFPCEDPSRWMICGGVDGLILLRQWDDYYIVNLNIILWNPSIHKSIHFHPPPLPDSWIPSEVCKALQCARLCLLFDASSDDYKVIMIRYRRSVDWKSDPAPLVDVFSLKSCSWRRVEVSHESPSRMRLRGYTGIGIGGSAHWIGDHFEQDRSQYQVSIISFHLNSNMFSCTPLPFEATNGAGQRWKIIVLPESTLGLLVEFGYKIIIWAKERSSVGSEIPECCWSIRYQIDAKRKPKQIGLKPPETFYVRVPLRKHGVVLWGSKSLQSYDLDTDKLKDLLKNYIYMPTYIGLYKESLLLLEHEVSPGMARDFAEPSNGVIAAGQ